MLLMPKLNINFDSNLFSDLLVHRREFLAVSTPGSVELDQDVLVNLGDDVFKVLAYGNNNGAAVVIGDGLRLHVGLQFVGLEVLQELLEHLHPLEMNTIKQRNFGVILR